MASQTIFQNSFLASFNHGNNFTVELDLRPPIVNVEYVRMIAEQICLVESPIFKPIYFLDDKTAQLVPNNQVIADKLIAYKCGVDTVDFQTIKIKPLEDKPEVDNQILFEFFTSKPQRNRL